MLRAIPIEEVLDLWPQVLPGLAAIRRRCKTPWTPSQICSHLLQARATLFVHEHGFVILERCNELWTGRMYLNAWLAWFKAGEAKKRKHKFVAWLDAMTQKHDCYTWKFGSPRKEWSHEMAEFCEVEMITWRRRKT